MKPMTAEALSALQKRCRFALFLSMILFLASLFALVSRWPAAYPLIACACVFHLVSNRFCKKRYTAAFTQALVEHAVQGRLPVTAFSASEPAEGLLARRGLTPDIPCVPGAKQHHVLHGLMEDAPFFMGEAAFVRRQGVPAMCSVSGTLIGVDGLLPEQEEWVLLRQEPFSALCPAQEYDGYVPLPLEGAPDGYAAWQRPGSTAGHLASCLSLLQENPDFAPMALAARGGSLSLFVPGAFYAPNRVDSTKPFSPRMLEGFRLPALELMEKMAAALSH